MQSFVNKNDDSSKEECLTYSVTDIDPSVIRLDIMSAKVIGDLENTIAAEHKKNPQAHQLVLYLGDPEQFTLTKNDVRQFIEGRTESWITSIRVEHAFYEWMRLIILAIQDNIKDIRFHHNDQVLDEDDIEQLTLALLTKSKNRTLYISPLTTDHELLTHLQNDNRLKTAWSIKPMPMNEWYQRNNKKTAKKRKSMQPLPPVTASPLLSDEKAVTVSVDDAGVADVKSVKKKPKAKHVTGEVHAAPIANPADALLELDIQGLRNEALLLKAVQLDKETRELVIPEPFTITPPQPRNSPVKEVLVLNRSPFSAFSIYKQKSISDPQSTIEKKSEQTPKY